MRLPYYWLFFQIILRPFSPTAALWHIKALISFQDGTENRLVKVAESKIEVKAVNVEGITLEAKRPFKWEVALLLEHERRPAAFAFQHSSNNNNHCNINRIHEIKASKETHTDFKVGPMVPFFVICGVQREPNGDVWFTSSSSLISCVDWWKQCHWVNNATL